MRLSYVLLCAFLLGLAPTHLFGGEVAVADFDGNGTVDFADYLKLARALGTDRARFDLNGDGQVGLEDYQAFSRVLGRASAIRQGLGKPLGRSGRAELSLRAVGGDGSRLTAQAGDTLQVEAFVEANNEAVTQVTLFLTIDERYLTLVPAGTLPQGGHPALVAFSQGEWLSGSLFFNDTLGDSIGNSDANQIPGFQLRYAEFIQKFQGAPQRSVTGSGVLARFRVAVTEAPREGGTRIRVDVSSPSGGETGYFIKGEPGLVYNFARVEELTVNAEGESQPPPASTLLVATVTRGGEPVHDLEVGFSRSVSGRVPDYKWEGTTDEEGRAEVRVMADPNGQFWRTGTPGYYVARAVDPQTGAVVGRWGSIPIPGGREVRVTLPIGEPAAVPRP